MIRLVDAPQISRSAASIRWNEDVGVEGRECTYLARSGEHMQRMAVATFLGSDRLSQAIRELAEDSIETEQLCLIGTPSHLHAVLESTSGRAPVLPPDHHHPTFDIGTLADGTPLVVAPAHFDRVDFGAELRPQGLLHGLDAALSCGAIALLVKTRSVAEFAAATRVLLRHSSHRVRTREVADRSID